MSNATQPRVDISSISDGETVHQRVLLIYGTLIDPLHQNAPYPQQNANVVLKNNNSSFPPQRFRCTDGVWKALAVLEPGENHLEVAFSSVNLDDQPDASKDLEHLDKGSSTFIKIHYNPLLDNPPLRLVIMVANDSDFEFDVPVSQAGIDFRKEAFRRFRMSAYMWQAFTAEQMWRSGFGRRTFRLDESLLPDTLSDADVEDERNTAQIYVARIPLTKKQLRSVGIPRVPKDKPPPTSTSTTQPPTSTQIPNDPTSCSDQIEDNDNDEDSNCGYHDFFSVFMDALQDFSAPFDSPCFVAGLIMDSHWDPEVNSIRAHTALGGGAGHRRLGIFGSHLMHGWPGSIEDMDRCLLDTTPIDPARLANDNGETGIAYKAFCIGSGAFLHEVGHALTCTHSGSGIMARGFNDFNRPFMSLERRPGSELRGITPEQEAGAHWHPVDMVRFRIHPCLRLPTDTDDSHRTTPGAPAIYATRDGISVHGSAGIALVEWEVEHKGLVEWTSFVQEDGVTPPRDLLISPPKTVQDQLENTSRKLAVQVTCYNQESNRIDDFMAYCRDAHFSLPGFPDVYKSAYVGEARSAGDRHHFSLLLGSGATPHLDSLIIYSDGLYIHGVSANFSDGTGQSFGSQDAPAHILQINPSESISRIMGRAGWWLDGLEIFVMNDRTRQERSLGWVGGQGGESRFELQAPKGYRVVGMVGENGDLLDRLAILYA
ncbi:putative peptidase family-domain-containing protein [Phlyctochytrium arcticum]|nr:putative peptidase family-domain-containing protein [Phlyctochytrium arcticum]